MKRYLQAGFAIVLSTALIGCPDKKPPQKAVPNPSAGGIVGFVGSANKAKMKIGLMAVVNAANTYRATENGNPEDVQALVEKGLLTADQAADLWGNDYVIDADGPSIVVRTYGADQEEGGTGPDTDWSSDELR
jgi:hypothetical protein